MIQLHDLQRRRGGKRTFSKAEGTLDPTIKIKPLDEIKIRTTVDALVKIRKQLPFLTFATSVYKLLGSKRKLRLLYQIAVTEFYWRNLDRPEFFEEHEAVVVGVSPDENFGADLRAPEGFDLDEEGSWAASDDEAGDLPSSRRRIVLVEGFPELQANLSSHPEVILVSPVSGSTPPRSVLPFDKVRGYILVTAFFAVIMLNVLSGLEPFSSTRFFRFFNKEWRLFLFVIGLLGIFLDVITFKQALGAQNGGTLMMFAFST